MQSGVSFQTSALLPKSREEIILSCTSIRRDQRGAAMLQTTPTYRADVNIRSMFHLAARIPYESIKRVGLQEVTRLRVPLDEWPAAWALAENAFTQLRPFPFAP
jgi:hypothetical protein